jgi:ketosteroid isomerase-like protein
MTSIAAPEWFTAALEALRAGDVDGFVAMYDDDAVHEFPWAPEGRPERLVGKPAIAGYMKGVPARVKLDAFDDVRIREAGDELIVEATAHGTRPDSGTPFDMQYVWFITHKDGRVSRFRDYMNPLEQTPRVPGDATLDEGPSPSPFLLAVPSRIGTATVGINRVLLRGLQLSQQCNRPARATRVSRSAKGDTEGAHGATALIDRLRAQVIDELSVVGLVVEAVAVV